MSLPRTGKTGLAKLATIFAIGFVISLGLCGINFFAVISDSFRGPNGSDFLIVSAYAELAGLVICGIGLSTVGLIALAQSIQRRFSNSRDSREDHP